MPLPIPGRVAERLRRSTVHIATDNSGHGSGMMLTGDRIVTNAHVVGAKAKVTVLSWEGRSVNGVVLRVDRLRDLALISAPGLQVPPLTLGDSDLLRPGTPVIAIGHPLGFMGAASSGVIHRLSRPWIVADVHLAPGNSGGPLANFHGEVIGVNAMVMAEGSSRLALAVPSRIVQQFLSFADSGRGLGAAVLPVRLRNGTPGLMLMEVLPDGRADRASLLPGDILVEAGGRCLSQPNDLHVALSSASSDVLTFRFYRGKPDRLREVAIAWNSYLPNAA